MKNLVALLGAAAVIGFAAPAHAEPEGDDAAFLANLSNSGITYSSPSQVITSAKAVCGLMGRGETGLQVVSDIKDQNPGMTIGCRRQVRGTRIERLLPAPHRPQGRLA
ncbi:hypothetical protein MTIM_19110 [Mycobacterium timonense]|uniref:DUF732 domain-containing protein n=1 Tax=Mycobacterium timonense TaxID=701043 RepID=A0A7I9Z595_9MYCO|nr:hypothetical protein MTIM_19110 [Mycobacterium timonense]